MPSFGGGPKTGHLMKLYLNTGSFGTPVWTLFNEIGDVSLPDFSIATAELKRRANNFTKNLASLFNATALEFRLHHGLDADAFGAVRGQFLARVSREWLIANGLIATIGTEGFRFPALVAQFPWDQPLEDVSGHDVRLELTMGGTKEVQFVTLLGGPIGGNFTLSVNRIGSNLTTANIAHNASNAVVQARLEALANVGVGGVIVTGGPLPNSTLTVTFLFDENVNQMTGAHTLTGGASPSVSIATSTEGSMEPIEPSWLVVT